MQSREKWHEQKSDVSYMTPKYIWFLRIILHTKQILIGFTRQVIKSMMCEMIKAFMDRNLITVLPHDVA